MTRNIVWGAVAAAGLLISGCSGEADVDIIAEEATAEPKITAADIPPRELPDYHIKQLNRMADAIATVEDKKSAKLAAQTIVDAAKEIEAVNEIIENMSPNERYSLMGHRTDDMMQAQLHMNSVFQKVAEEHPEQVLKLAKAMAKIPGHSAL